MKIYLVSYLIYENIFVGIVLYCDTTVGTEINIIYVVFNPKIITKNYLLIVRHL
jgi:hypothetical protein